MASYHCNTLSSGDVSQRSSWIRVFILSWLTAWLIAFFCRALKHSVAQKMGHYLDPITITIFIFKTDHWLNLNNKRVMTVHEYQAHLWSLSLLLSFCSLNRLAVNSFLIFSFRLTMFRASCSVPVSLSVWGVSLLTSPLGRIFRKHLMTNFQSWVWGPAPVVALKDMRVGSY